jgi:hypothetical protein
MTTGKAGLRQRRHHLVPLGPQPRRVEGMSNVRTTAAAMTMARFIGLPQLWSIPELMQKPEAPGSLTPSRGWKVHL